MPMTINTNVTSLNSQRALASTQSLLNTSMQRLSSGLRINSAKDDAAGMAIATRMDTQVRGQAVGIRNANDAISLTQTAEGAVSKVSDMLQRMRELAVQSANATNNTADRANLNSEFVQLGAEVTRSALFTKFNGQTVIGSQAGGITYQVGADTSDQVTVTTTNVATITSTVTSGNITSAENASSAMANIDTALTAINVERALYGAVQNRFEALISTLQISAENTAAAKGRIVDADFAVETANLSRAQILQQAGSAMLSQANQLPQQVLQLLRG